ncbi:MAG: putative Transposon Ty3-I Gag-Pol polyprotein [Streblomastix strix]|uniref:Putative Transposon Ty3-I Gag-Pol polyprotein n=1 Tax=Streblomastix strix TaxID=222440 RepID=A0A5J4UR63_9EUKA|nr:MAG: putative Transposon Ty3-I Gag-Pol polyprotein [Streblomastix strix]
MITAPQDKEERIGELIYKEKADGMGGRTKRFREIWEQIGKGEFINTGFYLRFKDQNSQQKLEENKMIVPFRGTQEEKKAYQEMLKEELEEGIVVPIQENQVKWWNHTFLIKKPNGTWRKILDASKLNKEIEKLHFKMHGLEEVQYLANQMDYATSLDLKSAFHHITQCHLGLKIAQSSSQKQQNQSSGRQEYTRKLKILNYCDYILLIHQDKQTLKTQTMEVMKTLKQFGWTISIDKCETEPKQVITFLGWIWNLKEMNIKMSEERKSKMIQALKDWCNTIYKSENVKIRQLAALIGRLNFLRPQIKEASLYLIELDKAKTQALKTSSWDGIMTVNKTVIKELKWWIRRIGDNQPQSLINKTITCMLTTDASPQGWGATLIYENQIELIQHDCWSEKEAEMTSNAKEIKAIYYGLLRFEQVFKKMQDQAVLIRSDNTTAVYDIGKWKAKESLTERIKQVFYLVKRLKLQITTIHIPGNLNTTTDSLSRLCRSGDYSLKDGMIQMICKTWNYMPEIDIFATQYNKLINNYVTVDLNDLGTRFHNAFNYKWSKVKLYIHPPIPVLNRVLQKMKQDKAQGIVIAPIWPGQSWYTKLKSLSTKFLFLGQADKTLEMGQRMKDKDQKLPPGNVGAFLLDLSQMLGETYQ